MIYTDRIIIKSSKSVIAMESVNLKIVNASVQKKRMIK